MRVFPTPGDSERAWLYDSLSRILMDAPWLAPFVGGAAVEPALQALWQRTASLIPERERGSSFRMLRGDHGNAGAIIGRGVASPELSRLQGLFWVSSRRWLLAGRFPCPALEAMASALRAAITSPASPAAVALGPIFAELRLVEDMSSAIRTLASLQHSAHVGLRDAWTRGLQPVLADLLPEALSPTTQAPREDGQLLRGVMPVRARSKNVDRDEITQAIPRVLPLRRKTPFVDQVPGEPTDEFSLPVDLVLVPGYGTGAVSRRRAQYLARQTIWSRNVLLLPAHVEAMVPDVYRAAVRSLVGALDRDDLTEWHLLGNVVCLLKAITGRATPAIKTLCADSSPKLPGGMWIDLDRGVIEFPPFWKITPEAPTDGRMTADLDAPTGYFRPSNRDQADRVSPVCDRISLPLVRPIHRVLQRHASRWKQLAYLPEGEVDRSAAEASAILSAGIGARVSVAALRRSLGPLVMEATGDLALAQLICGDSFGRPLAHQHYYSPRRKDIASAYRNTVAIHFESSTTTPILMGGARIGSELLVTPEAARVLARSSTDAVDSCEERGACARSVARHRALVDHLARMILATTGHRPSEALFQLTVHDLDLRSGAALFRDKRIDAAHDPRLATLPEIVCQQIEVYLHHLHHLKKENVACQRMVDAVCSGLAPLLFDLDDYLAPKPLALSKVKGRSSAEWNSLPWNWGRTYLRTRGIECGAPPFLMACQLGHLDAVGYPYSQQSPTAPAQVVRETRPWLDRLARNQAWVVKGKDSIDPADLYNTAKVQLTLPPLADWGDRIAQADREALRVHREWERSLHTNARRARERARQLVLDHPALVAAGISAAFLSENTPEPDVLDELDVLHIQSDLLDSVGDDAPAAIAVTRALRQILGHVAKRTRKSYPVIPLPVAIRRPLDNPFFAGACLAWTQMHSLRDHVAERSARKPARSFLLQVARTAESLALFSFVDEHEWLWAILGARSRAAPSARLPDLMLVPLADGEVVALRGVAALALANLGQCYPTEPLPDREDVDVALAQLLPQWAVGGEPTGLLQRLCSTTSVVNRFELSPAARFATNPLHGSTHASLAEQLAYIDRDPVGPIRPPTEKLQRTGCIGTRGQDLDHAPCLESPRKQYRALCRTIPRPHRDLVLPVTGRRIGALSLQSASTREAMIAELDAQLARPTLYPIVRMLGEWIRAESQREANRNKPLAYRTLETYLTRIGGALVEVVGVLDFARWDEHVLEDAYLYALDSSDKAREKVAAGLLSFHRFCDSRWDMPEVDLSFLFAELRADRQHADSALILPVERDEALEHLRHCAWENDRADFGEARVARHADCVAYFLAWGGARLSEALGLQVRDVAIRPNGSLGTTVRSNRLRPLKTPAAHRALSFHSEPGEPAHRQRVAQRIDDVRRVTAVRRPDSAYLIHDDVGDCTGHATSAADAIARAIRLALADATGRPTERLHRLRHLAVMQALVGVALAPDDVRWMDIAAAISSCAVKPRDLLAISSAFGHSHWRTTLQWYLHLPWILQSREAQHMREEYFTRRYVAGALGYSRSLFDSLLRDRNVEPVWAWFDHFRVARAAPIRGDTAIVAGSQPLCVNWTAELVGQLVNLAGKTKDFESAMRVIGAPQQQAARVLVCAEKWEAKLGLRLLPAYADGKRRRCPGRAVRRLHADQPLERLWRLADIGREETRYQNLINEYFTWLSPTRPHEVVLPRPEAHDLGAWLQEVGIHEDQLCFAERLAATVGVSILRRGSKQISPPNHVLGLRRVLAVIGMAFDIRAID